MYELMSFLANLAYLLIGLFILYAVGGVIMKLLKAIFKDGLIQGTVCLVSICIMGYVWVWCILGSI